MEMMTMTKKTKMTMRKTWVITKTCLLALMMRMMMPLSETYYLAVGITLRAAWHYLILTMIMAVLRTTMTERFSS